MSKILGISAFYHDSAACITIDGKIIAAAQEERFSRKKHDAGFPIHAIQFCLNFANLEIDDLDAVVFYDKPLLKFERLLETYYAFAPKGILSFFKAIPVWLKEKIFLKRLIYDGLKEVGIYNKKRLTLLFPEHHLSHAASTFYPSPFQEAAILTIDGVGEWATASICYGKGNKITVLKELAFPHSLGLLYSSFTYFLGFRVNSGEYKLMGLAPYGNPDSRDLVRFKEIIKSKLIQIKKDGSLYVNQKYFDYATGLTMVNAKQWEILFGITLRKQEDEITQIHCDLALAIQQITEEIVLAMATEAKRLTGSNNICLAGGVALNCVSNGKLQDSKIFENVFITPPSGDAGGALGAALSAEHIYFNSIRIVNEDMDGLQGAYLGPEIEPREIEKLKIKYKACAIHFEKFENLTTKVAQLLNDGMVIGWVQGRMEFGPRALGNRSILGDPRNPEMQKKLNLKIKYRESFRPFAPSVLAEDVHRYFEMEGISPYMLMVKPIQTSIRNPLPANYSQLDMKDKLYFSRSSLPAITHIDFSARIQTVHKQTNHRYHTLLSAFKTIAGIGVLVNTSFNVRGEPIVNTAEDAYRCFMRTEMDYLVIGNELFEKHSQPTWVKTDNWKEEFILD